VIEIRFHGRGGQGAVTGSETLAHAFFLESKFVQAFPAFGVERRGAPVMAFCRVDERPIRTRNQIYTPDHVIILDSSLLDAVNVTEGLKPDGTILINGKRSPEQYRKNLPSQFRLFIVDAGAIALEHGLGSPANPIVNTAILGAFAKATAIVKLESVLRAIEETVFIKPEQNMASAKDAYHKVIET